MGCPTREQQHQWQQAPIKQVKLSGLERLTALRPFLKSLAASALCDWVLSPCTVVDGILISQSMAPRVSANILLETKIIVFLLNNSLSATVMNDQTAYLHQFCSFQH